MTGSKVISRQIQKAVRIIGGRPIMITEACLTQDKTQQAGPHTKTLQAVCLRTLVTLKALRRVMQRQWQVMTDHDASRPMGHLAITTHH